MVPIAWFQGIDPVILPCDDGDIAARQAIDAYGGTMQHPQGNRRYLIPAQDLLRTS